MRFENSDAVRFTCACMSRKNIVVATNSDTFPWNVMVNKKYIRNDTMKINQIRLHKRMLFFFSIIKKGEFSSSFSFSIYLEWRQKKIDLFIKRSAPCQQAYTLRKRRGRERKRTTERATEIESRIASFSSYLTIVLCLFIVGKLLSNEFDRKKNPSQNGWMAGPWHTHTHTQTKRILFYLQFAAKYLNNST